MTEKWKDFLSIIGIETALTGSEVAWTGFLVSTASRIPYVGVPIAVLLGATGIGCTLWLANNGRFAIQDWHKKYYTIN